MRCFNINWFCTGLLHNFCSNFDFGFEYEVVYTFRIYCTVLYISRYSNLNLYRKPKTLKESNAKCRHLKKLTCKGILWQVFICLRPRTPFPPDTLFTCIQYTFFTKERGRESWTREATVSGATVHKAGFENTNMTDCISTAPVYKSLINNCPFIGQFF